MTLGERVYQLRTVRGLSQSDLAEALDVSRQSVSKWETNASVPDLDKLVKMCELFGVSMDALVRGEEEEGRPQPASVIRQEKGRLDVRTMIGLILIVFGLLCFILAFFLHRWGLDDAMVYSAPFLLCGVLCLTFKRHPVLACGWGLWGLMTLILLPFVGLYLFSYAVIRWFTVVDLILLTGLTSSTVWIKRRNQK